MNSTIQWFVTSVMTGVVNRNTAMRSACGMPPASWNRRLLALPSVTALVSDYRVSPELHVVEFVGEVLFPYEFDAVYASLKDKDHHELSCHGLFVDPKGRPEAIVDLVHGSPEAHYATLQAVRQPLKDLQKVTVTRDWHWDPVVELQNIRYHVEREGGNPEHAFDYVTHDFYAALEQVAAEDPRALWREDFWYGDQFLGHSLWAACGDEMYWVSPVTARTPLAQKLRVGNMMFLHGIRYGYEQGFARINMGVDEFSYKSEFWKTRRIYKPGLRRF